MAYEHTTTQHGTALQITEGRATISQGLVHSPVKKLSVRAPVCRPTRNASRARQPIAFGKNSGIDGDVTKVATGTLDPSLIAPHKLLSPPFATSQRPCSPLSDARDTSGIHSTIWLRNVLAFTCNEQYN